MSASWNFARRPFRDERPVLATIGLALLVGLALLASNLNLYWKFSRQVQGTRSQIDALQTRAARAAKAAEEARTALNGYKLSSLAQESAGLQTIVRERKFSWLALLARLERTLPSEVRLSRLVPRFDSADAVAVDLAVLGRDQDSVIKTIAALSKDPAFRDVELRSESTPEKGVPEGHTFQIVLLYVATESR